MVVIFDLDDTLYPEMEFVRSAYRVVARRYGSQLLPPMLAAPTPREAFDSTGLPIEEVLELYRSHRPDIRLPWQSLYVMSVLGVRDRGPRPRALHAAGSDADLGRGRFGKAVGRGFQADNGSHRRKGTVCLCRR